MIQDHLKIPTADNQSLDALLLYVPDYPGKRPAILVIHGWTSNKKRYIQRVASLVEMGYVCLLFDMRGHGKSDGKLEDLSRRDHLTDCLAAYDYLANLKQVDAKDISVFGSSYGGYLASVVAGERQVSHLVLKAPAQYPDDSFEIPSISVRHSMLEEYRHKKIDASDNKAFRALTNFKGEVLLLECEKDEVIPHQTTRNYLGSFSIDPDHFVLKDSDHSSSKPEFEHDFIEALKDWFKDVREERIVETLRKKYPGKAITERPGFFPAEFLCEVDPSSDHSDYSLAVAVIDESAPHVHHKTTETYTIIEGTLVVYKNGKSFRMTEGEKLVIKPGEVHWAKGHETWIECYSEPGWTIEDHILVKL